MKFSDKQNVALVLSGGGIKAAAFHIGVCLALKETGFTFRGGQLHAGPMDPPKPLEISTYVGSSAGSVIAAYLASGYSIESIVAAFTKGMNANTKGKKPSDSSTLRPLTYKDVFALNLNGNSSTSFFHRLFKKKPVISGGIEALLKRGFRVNGLFSTKNLEKYLREAVLTSNDFRELNAKLYVIATQLNHSRKVVFGGFEETLKEKDIKYANYASISQAVAASASLPPFFSPYGIQNKKGKEIFFFDGEIRDTLSTHVAADHGADLVISSYSIQPYHFSQEMGSLHEYGMPIIFNQALYQVVQQKIERHIKHQKDMRAMINAVSGYLKQAAIPAEHVEKLIEILMTRTGFNPKVEYIYIHPSPHDYEMFFYDHFSLNPRILNSIVRTGFKAAMATLRSHNMSY